MVALDRGTHLLHYEIRGPADAPPVLLIMGLSFSSRAWHTLPERLERTFRVITFDNAGSGRSTAPRSLSVAAMADDAAAVLDAAAVDRAAVFGISMGGMIAIELALRHAARLRKLVLGATHGGFRSSVKASASTMAMLSMAMLAGGRISPRRMAKFLTSEAHFDRDAEGFTAWLAETNPSRLRSSLLQLQAIFSHAAEKRLAQIKTPTLILTGDRDLLVPPENSRRLAASIPGARLIEYPGVGHCFPVERPDEVARALEEFFLSD